MFNKLSVFYILLSLIIASIDFFMAGISFKNDNGFSKTVFGVLSINAGLVALVYLLSVLSHIYIFNSIVSSVYFILIDTLLLIFLIFITVYTQNLNKLPNSTVFNILYILVLIDSISLALNPLFEHALSYSFNPDVLIAHYSYSMHLFYYLHLIFTYGMVIAIVALLVIQTIRSRKEYKAVYYKPLIWVLLLVFLNAIFLFRKGNTLFDLVDISIVGYSIILITMYLSFFSLGQQDVKKELAYKVFDNFDQYIFVFDEKENFVMRNQSSNSFFTNLKLSKDFTLSEFIEKSQIPIYKPYNNQKENFSYLSTLYDYEFQCLYEQNKITGYLVVISRQKYIKDSLTNCYYLEYLDSINHKSLKKRGTPICISIFNIAALGIINSMYSYRQGNELILSLIDSINTVYPENTIVIRLKDATFLAISFSIRHNEVENLIRNVKNIYSGVLYTSSKLVEEYENIKTEIELLENELLSKKPNNKEYSKIMNSMISYQSIRDEHYLQRVENLKLLAESYLKDIGLYDEYFKRFHTLIMSSGIGNIGVPRLIMLKKNPSNDEINIIQDHTLRGYKISFLDEYLKDISDDILYHHENYDGSGYPYGISKDEIPYMARLFRILYDYETFLKTNNKNKAIILLEKESGKKYDPTILASFISFIKKSF